MRRVTQYTVQRRKEGGDWEVFPWPQRSMAGPWVKRERADKLYVRLAELASTEPCTFVYGYDLRVAERTITYDAWEEAS